jgi:hypothetical protein
MFVPIAASIVGDLIRTKKLPAHSSVVEMGNQTYSVDGVVIKALIEDFEKTGKTLVDEYGIDMKALQVLSTKPAGRKAKDPLAPRVSEFFKALNFSYEAIDINADFDSIVMDLNTDLRGAYNFQKTYNLVTNIGVSEHLFNQEQFFKNAHYLTKKDGIMLHILPFLGHINHGFYNYEPRLFFDLAAANGYELLGLKLAERNRIVSDLLVPNEVLVHFHHYLPFLITNDLQNGFVVAILRKTEDNEFTTPLQGKYIQDLGNDTLKQIYGSRKDVPLYPPPKGMFETPSPDLSFKGKVQALRKRIKRKILRTLFELMRSVLIHI